MESKKMSQKTSRKKKSKWKRKQLRWMKVRQSHSVMMRLRLLSKTSTKCIR